MSGSPFEAFSQKKLQETREEETRKAQPSAGPDALHLVTLPADDDADIFKAASNKIIQADAEQVTMGLRLAAQHDPDTFAAAKRIADRDGYPIDFAIQNLPSLKKREIASEMRILAEKNPTIKEILKQRDTGAIVKVDDLDHVDGLQWAFRATGEAFSRGAAELQINNIGGQALREGRALTADEDKRVTELELLLGDDRSFGADGWFDKTLTETAKMTPGALQSAGEAAKGGTATMIGGTLLGAVAGAAAGGVGAIPGAYMGWQASVPLAGAVATGGAVLDAYGQEGGGAYLEYRKIKDANGKPIDDRLARIAAAGVGLLNASLELGADAVAIAPGVRELVSRYGARKLMAEALRKPEYREVLTSFLTQAGVIAGTQVGTEVLQEAVTLGMGELAKLAQGGDQKYASPDQWMERIGKAAEAAAQFSTLLAPIAASPAARTAYRNVRRAEENAKFFTTLQQKATEFELRSRSPETADAVIRQAAKDSGMETVYMPVGKLDELFQQNTVTPADMERAVPGFSEQYAEAQAAGRDIEIPFEAFHNKIAGTPLGEAMINHVRFDPAHPTLDEAKEFRANQDTLLADFAADVDQRQAREREEGSNFNRVMTDRIAALEAVGMDRKRAEYNAAVEAAWVMTQASRGRGTVDELMAALPEVARTVQAEDGSLVAGRMTLAQGDLSGDASRRENITGTPEFQNWFGNSSVRDEAGQPLVVYHGTRRDFEVFKDKGERGFAGFFTAKPSEAEVFASEQESDGGIRIVPVYLKAEKPWDYKNPEHVAAIAQEMGYDDEQAKRLADGAYEYVEDAAFAIKDMGFDAAYVNENGGRSWADEQRHIAVFEPTQIKSVNNRGTFDANDPRILYQSANELRDNPTILERDFGLERTGPGNTVVTRKLAEALQKWSVERSGQIDRNDRSEESAAKIGGWIADEVERDFRNAETDGNSAVGWYTVKWQQAMDQFGGLFPELLTEQTARDAFTLFFAVTSDGQKVFNNARLAVQAYEYFRENGTAPATLGMGERTAGYEANAERINILLGKYGVEGLRSFLMQELRVSDLKKMAKAEGLEVNTNYTAKMMLPISAIYLGPKLGAFFSNLMGATGYLTMDRWWTRSFNRYRGQLIPVVKKESLDRFRGIIGKPKMPDAKLFVEITNLRNSYDAKGYKNGTAAEKAANTLFKDLFVATEDMPFNSTDREFQVKAAHLAREELARRGIDITIADIQAVLWYYEKRLFAELGVRPSGDVSYAEAAQRIVNERRGSGGSDLRDAEGDQASDPSDDAGEASDEADSLFQSSPERSAGRRSVRSGENRSTQALAEGYKAAAGIDKPPLAGKVTPDIGYLKAVGDWLDAAEHRPDDADVKASYDALASETVAQYRYLIDNAGIAVEAFDGDGEPYANSTAMMQDVEDNQHLWFFRTENGFGETGMDPGHPMVQPTEFEDQAGRTLLVNDLFRIVHDFFGHTQNGFQFGPVGEYNAFQEHARMFSDAAVPALAAETLAQNAWVNFGPHIRRADGSIPRVNDPDFVPQKDRPFAAQKSTIVPLDLLKADPSVEAAGHVLNQLQRGSITFGGERPIIQLFEAEDASTFQHEAGHFYLRMARQFALREGADPEAVADWNAIKDYLDVGEDNLFTVEMEEKWARSWEAYLMEGRSPSARLSEVFAKFRQWLIRIYKSAQGLNVEITPDVRQVMDRLVASDEEIETQTQAREYQAAFKSAEEANMSGDQYVRYLTLATRADDEAKAELTTRLMEDIQRESDAVYRERKREIRDEVQAELREQRPYRVRQILSKGKEFDGTEVAPAKIDTGSVIAVFGREVAAQLQRQAVPPILSTSNDAIHIEDIAEIFGYGSAQEMVRELTETPALGRAIAEESARRLSAELPSLLENRAARQEAALNAIHNDARLQFIEAELVEFAKRAGQPRPQRMIEAAKQAARQTFLYRRALDIKPHIYRSAEARAAREVEKALSKQDWHGAAEQKRRQLWAHAHALEAKRAQDDIRKAVKYLSRFANDKRPDKVAFDYLDQIDALLERFEVGNVSAKALGRRSDLRSYVEEQEELGNPVAIPDKLLNEAYRKNWKEMTTDEMLALQDAVKQLENLGRLKKKILDGRQQRDFEAVKGELIGAATAIRQRGADDPRQRSGWGNFKEDMLSITASFLRMEQVVDWLDGGNVHGPWRRVLWERMSRAQVREMDMQAQYTAAIIDIFNETPAGYLQEKFEVSSLGKSYTREQIYAFALNTGSESNLDKMMRGEDAVPGGGLSTPALMSEALDHLTEQDWDRIQKVWDTINSLWPDLAALQKRLTGVEPEKILARSFTISGKQYAGGYYPMVYDSEMTFQVARNADTEAQRLMADSSFIRPTVMHGHREARTKGFAAPISTDLRVVATHITKVIHDITHWEAVRDTYKVLSDPEIRGALSEALGRQVYGEMIKWTNRIANDRNMTPVTPFEKKVQGLRSRIALMGMGYRISTMLMQFVGWSNSMELVKPRHLIPAMMKSADALRAGEVHQFIVDKSGEMRHRATSMERDIREHMRQAIGGDSPADKFRRFAFYGITMIDRVVTDTTWLGAYNQHLEQSPGDDAGAVTAADRAVRMTQGAGGAKDISSLQANRGWQSLFTMFYSYFNLYFNRLWDTGRHVLDAKERGTLAKDMPHILARVVAHTIVPAVLADLLVLRGPDDDEIEEDGVVKAYTQWAALKVLLYPLASVPIVREVATAIERGDPSLKAPYAQPIEAATKLVGQLQRSLVDGEDLDGRIAAKRTADLVGYAMGLPVGQFTTTGSNIWMGIEQEDFLLRDLFLTRNQKSDGR